MKTNTLLVRTAALSALVALGACNSGPQPSLADHDPYQKYKLGTVYDCDQEAQPDMRYNFDNLPSAGFGCAHQSNITAMVADPADLQRPRDETPSDVRVRDRVFNAYRDGKETSVSKRAKGTKGLIE